MKTNFILMGIAILMATPSVSAFDAQARDGKVPELSDTLSIQEAVIHYTFASTSSSPLRLTTIDVDKLKSRATARTYPELLKDIPGLYGTSESGSYGDARLNIRGFRQENISVMLNGIPISGLVSGSMYWNNWMGLADATYSVQVQKGTGSSLLADGSVGGTVNVVTDAVADRFRAETGIYGGLYGTVKAYLKVSSGELPKGWAVNAMASYVGGKGYVDATNVNSYAYMLNVSKHIGPDHVLIFTALGSPEKHDQRSTRLSSAEIDRYGVRYNKNWGWRDGEEFNLSSNHYFKPYFTLQHIWKGERISMRNSLYLALANGGGRWSETKGAPVSSFMKDGQIDWAAAIDANRTADLSNGAGLTGTEGVEAMNILSDYQAGHTQAGAIASMEYKITERWKLGAGLHYMYYSTWEREQITDLLGADYWYEDYVSKSLAGLAGRDPIKHVGDFVRTNNGKTTNHGTVYLSASHSSEHLNVNIGASGFGCIVRRWDRYNYLPESCFSDIAGGLGASIKAGVLYKIDRRHAIYASGGWYSRLPYSNVWFSSGNNEISKDVHNERNILGELGWRFVWNRGGLELTGYYAYWKNKTLMSNPYKVADQYETKYMVTGLDAAHAGFEAEVYCNITEWLKISAFASVGDWRWKNDVQAGIFDNYSGMEIGRVNVYADGLPVGDAPQTQLGAVMEVRMPAGFALLARWQFNDRMYADFDPVTRTDSEDRSPSYRFPSCHLLGASLSWTREQTSLREPSFTVFLTGENLLDVLYIERGKDGATHDLASFRGYWGFGRNFSFGLRLSF
ncbi:MAG: TonB-dependent receptor [Candidatus Cryptobacteroides sp.]